MLPLLVAVLCFCLFMPLLEMSYLTVILFMSATGMWPDVKIYNRLQEACKGRAAQTGGFWVF